MTTQLEKIGSGLTKLLDKIRKIDSVKIDRSEWSKTDKKAQIVDLWHQSEKVRNGSDKYDRHFDFAQADKNGVEFWLYNANLGMANVICKKLTALEVKHQTVGGPEDCEKAVAG